MTAKGGGCSPLKLHSGQQEEKERKSGFSLDEAFKDQAVIKPDFL